MPKRLRPERAIEIVNRANQRGGRMLSVIDLIETGTVTPALAAFILRRIAAGSGFLVGANPGGAGKTTVMGAFLALLPPGEPVRVFTDRGGGSEGGFYGAAGENHCAAGENDSAAGENDSGDGSAKTAADRKECVVAYEISPGHWDGYIWGAECRKFADLGLSGTRIVSNLHADTLEEARLQLSRDNGLTSAQIETFGLFIPIRLRREPGGIRRKIDRVYPMESPEGSKAGGTGSSPPLDIEARRIERFLLRCRKEGILRIEEVREKWLESDPFRD